jgi:hypothetical protein
MKLVREPKRILQPQAEVVINQLTALPKDPFTNGGGAPRRSEVANRGRRILHRAVQQLRFVSASPTNYLAYFFDADNLPCNYSD